MPTIQCTAKILGIGSWAVVRIPKEASEGLGSRSMVMIDGKINDLPFATPLEPDGKGSHWFRLSEAILKAGKLAIGDTIKLEFSQTENWVEPELPPDLEEALKAASLLEEPWQGLTARAKWEWVRWIRSTKNDATRKKRIQVAVDKLNKGLKRPCCFNSSSSTEPTVSHNGYFVGEL